MNRVYAAQFVVVNGGTIDLQRPGCVIGAIRVDLNGQRLKKRCPHKNTKRTEASQRRSDLLAG